MEVFQHQHIGKRKNQEDSYGHNKNAFIVCDGVGGSQKGEVASKFIVKAFLEKTEQEAFKTTEDIHECIKVLQQDLHKQAEKNPDREGMGTTLVAFVKVAECWCSLHIGDSRLYWAKPTKSIWHTWDHSFVGQLVKSGEITREDGRNHPRNNEIQRAIIAQKDKSNRGIPEITFLAPLKKGDMILLCSDGVNEVWSDYKLAEVLLDKKTTGKEKSDLIFNKAKEQADDNNTAILIEIKEDMKCSQATTSGWINLKELEKDYELSKTDLIEETDSEDQSPLS